MPQYRRPILRLIGYELFDISAVFLRSLEYEVRVSQWGPTRRPRLLVHRHEKIQSSDQLCAAIEEPCAVSLISGHAGEGDNGTWWLSKDRGGKIGLNLAQIGRLGAASAVILDACFAWWVLPELARHAEPDVVFIGVNSTFTDGRMSVTVLADLVRELCHPIDQEGLEPAAVLAAADRVEQRVKARNRLAKPRDRTPGVLVYHYGAFNHDRPVDKPEDCPL